MSDPSTNPSLQYHWEVVKQHLAASRACIPDVADTLATREEVDEYLENNELGLALEVLQNLGLHVLDRIPEFEGRETAYWDNCRAAAHLMEKTENAVAGEETVKLGELLEFELTYCTLSGAAYLKPKDREDKIVGPQKETEDGLILDLDKDRKVIGVEILVPGRISLYRAIEAFRTGK